MSVEHDNEEFTMHGADAKGDVDGSGEEGDDGNEDEDDDASEEEEKDEDEEEEEATNRGRWSMEEDEQLRKAIGTYTNHKYNWHAISLLVPGRTPLQCANRYRQALDKSVSKGRWTASDDAAVMAHVAHHGLRNWSSLGFKLGRLGKQCRERYFNCLDNTIDRSVWTDDEEMTLIDAQLRHGNRWAQIALVLPGRTANAVKNHWHSAVRRRRMAAIVPQIEAKIELERQQMAAQAAATDLNQPSPRSNQSNDSATTSNSSRRGTQVATPTAARTKRAARLSNASESATNDDNKRRRTILSVATTPTVHVDHQLPSLSSETEKTAGPTPPLLSAAVRTRAAVTSSLKDLVVFCEQALLGSDV